MTDNEIQQQKNKNIKQNKNKKVNKEKTKEKRNQTVYAKKEWFYPDKTEKLTYLTQDKFNKIANEKKIL